MVWGEILEGCQVLMHVNYPSKSLLWVALIYPEHYPNPPLRTLITSPGSPVSKMDKKMERDGDGELMLQNLTRRSSLAHHHKIYYCILYSHCVSIIFKKLLKNLFNLQVWHKSVLTHQIEDSASLQRRNPEQISAQSLDSMCCRSPLFCHTEKQKEKLDKK